MENAPATTRSGIWTLSLIGIQIFAGLVNFGLNQNALTATYNVNVESIVEPHVKWTGVRRMDLSAYLTRKARFHYYAEMISGLTVLIGCMLLSTDSTTWGSKWIFHLWVFYSLAMISIAVGFCIWGIIMEITVSHVLEAKRFTGVLLTILIIAFQALITTLVSHRKQDEVTQVTPVVVIEVVPASDEERR